MCSPQIIENKQAVCRHPRKPSKDQAIRASSAASLFLILSVFAAPAVSGAPQSARSLARDALSCFDSMDYETGLKLAGSSLEKDPAQVLLRIRQAAILWKLGRRDVARMSVQKALELEPENWEALTLADYFFYQDGKADKAEALSIQASSAVAKTLRPESRVRKNWPPAFVPGPIPKTSSFNSPDSPLPPNPAFNPFGQLPRPAPAKAKTSAILPRILFPPNAGLAPFLQGILLEKREGWTPQVEACFRRAMDLSYDGPACALAIGFGRMSLHDWKGAGEIARDSLDEGGLRPELFVLAAAAAEAGGNRNASEDALEIAVELRPFEGPWLKALAAAYADRLDWKRSAAFLKTAVLLDPADFEARDWLAAAGRGAATLKGAFAGALEKTAGALRAKLEPQYLYPLFLDINSIAPAVNDRFFRFVQAGQLEDAAIYVRNFLEIDSQAPELSYNLAQLYNTLGLPGSSFVPAWTALANRPSYRDALDLAGQLLLRVEDFERSIQFYRMALEASSDIQAWFNLGFAHFAAGDRAEAERRLLGVLELEKAAGSPRKEKSGSAAAKKLDYALDITVEPLTYRALLLLGRISAEREDLSAAENYIHRAAVLQPQTPDAYLELGRVFLAKKDMKAAKAAFDRFVSLGGEPAKVPAIPK